jgi:Chaperone of endosialidase
MKKDIEALDTEDALDEIMALRPVVFTWKKTGVADMGPIAQEVDPVFPELVTHGGADETLALKYTSLIAPMIASIQELKKLDDEPEIENASLRRDFNTYKAAHP